MSVRKHEWMLIVAVAAGLLAVGGCSGVIAKSDMASTIDANAAAATLVQSAAATSQPSVDTAKAGLATNATTFAAYYSAATVNPFAYLFGDKQIWCTATYYSLLQKNSVAGGQFSTNAAAGKYGDATVEAIYLEELKWLLQVKDAKDGKDTQK